jgi:hypothetical protein
MNFLKAFAIIEITVNEHKHLSLQKNSNKYFLMKINKMRLVFQNNVFLIYFPEKKQKKTLKLTLGMLIFQFGPNFWIPWVKISHKHISV